MPPFWQQVTEMDAAVAEADSIQIHDLMGRHLWGFVGPNVFEASLPYAEGKILSVLSHWLPRSLGWAWLFQGPTYTGFRL
jgi:hypothetical protein